MGYAISQQIWMTTPNPLGFDDFDREVIDTTSGAAATTSQPLRMFLGQQIDLTVDLLVQDP